MTQAALEQNWFATLALLAWPIVALWLYYTRPVGPATLWTVLGGYLVLPVDAGIKLAEGIPKLDKTSIPVLAAFAGCFIFAKRRLIFWNEFGLAEVFLVVFLISPLVTSELNSDPVVSGAVLLPGVSAYDGLSAIVAQSLFALPFFIGRQLLRDSADVEGTLRTLVIAGFIYSLPMLFEIRMSPQLHSWLYGYSPIGFGNEMRYGGFRPTVFLQNGLVTAFFLMTAIVAGAALWRTRSRLLKPAAPAVITAYMSSVLILCKSLGALVYGAALVPLVLLTRPRLQLWIAMVLVMFTLAYPLLRIVDLVPTGYMFDTGALVNEERAASLEYRFIHEKQLLEHASQRLLFGWGRFGRNRIYDEYGNDASVSDGQWILTLGIFGIFGFFAEFGLFGLPVYRAASALKFAKSERDRVFLAALSLIIAIIMIDQLPNASRSSWTWLLAGALLGRAEALRGGVHQVRRFNGLVGLSRNGARATFYGGLVRTPLRASELKRKR
jgi:O-antigen ligase